MSAITLEQARTIISSAFAKGAQAGMKPLSVLVLDAGGYPLAFERQDGASIGRFAIAMGKASGALQLGVSSRTVGDMAADRPLFIGSLHPLLPHGAIPVAGGVLVADGEGRVIGAVGVTGDTSDNDEACALAGIEAAGLSAKN